MWRISFGTVRRFHRVPCACCHFVRAVQSALSASKWNAAQFNDQNADLHIVDHVPSERYRLTE